MRHIVNICSCALLFVIYVSLISSSNAQVGLEAENPTTMRKPMFKVEAIDFICFDESGADIFGSDEVVTFFHSVHGNPSLMVPRKIGNVDKADREEYGAKENCILPIRPTRNVGASKVLQAPEDTWQCRDGGTPGPIQFTVYMYEDDHHITLPFCFTGPASEGLDIKGKDCYDDLIGRDTISYSEAVLVSMLPNVGDSRRIETILGGPCGHVEPGDACGTGWLSPTGPEYQFSYRITRLPDKIFDSQILDNR